MRLIFFKAIILHLFYLSIRLRRLALGRLVRSSPLGPGRPA
jgi:hypothetical protein